MVGAANRLFEALHEAPKTYVAQVSWGLETDTGDAGGREVRRGDVFFALGGLRRRGLEFVEQAM